jgi:YegS/Rv2252/BmrU family lipid kinase
VAAPVCLIVNPSAGGGRAARLAPAVERTLRDRGLQVRRHDTRDLDHARDLARQAAAGGEMVVALSGDGLIRVLADTLREVPGVVLGVLPGGRGNDLARVLEISDDAEQACATIVAGLPRPIDLGVVEELGAEGDGTAFVGIASAGFDSDANRIANEAPSWLGGLVYAYGALRALISWRPAHFEIELLPSGERHAFTGYTIAAANSRAYGGGMLVAPAAMLDDGQLDVVAVERVSRLRFLASLSRVFKGTHVELPNVRVFRSPEIRISADRPFVMYADGDPIGTLPVRVRALPGAVTVMTPAGGSAALSEPGLAAPIVDGAAARAPAAGSAPTEA